MSKSTKQILLSLYKACQRKVSHTSERKATSAMKSLKEKEGENSENLSVYYCATCHGWHVGHKKEYKKRKVAGE